MGVVTTPSLEGLRAYASADPSVRRVPIARDYPGDVTTTTCALRALRAASRHCFLLESADPDKRAGRYSFIGFDPALEVTCQEGSRRIRDNAGNEQVRQVDHPADAIRRSLKGADGRQERIQRSMDYIKRFDGKDVAGQVFQLYQQLL